MSKASWREEHEEEMKNYGKSILSHSDDYDYAEDYDKSIGLHYECDSLDDYESCIKHFQD